MRWFTDFRSVCCSKQFGVRAAWVQTMTRLSSRPIRPRPLYPDSRSSPPILLLNHLLGRIQVYVGSVSALLDEDKIRQAFCKYGSITTIRMHSDKGFAFVEFKTHEVAPCTKRVTHWHALPRSRVVGVQEACICVRWKWNRHDFFSLEDWGELVLQEAAQAICGMQGVRLDSEKRYDSSLLCMSKVFASFCMVWSGCSLRCSWAKTGVSGATPSVPPAQVASSPRPPVYDAAPAYTAPPPGYEGYNAPPPGYGGTPSGYGHPPPVHTMLTFDR